MLAAMATEWEKEREAELESAMYTNCLLLSLDPAVLGFPAGAGGGPSPRAGFFRHSNPKMGEQLLYFLLLALRGPEQSAKEWCRGLCRFDAEVLRQLEKPLKDQFMVRRALEKALGYKSSAIDSSNDSSMPKLDKREPDDSFLSLVIWTPGETSQSNEPPEICCNSQETGKFCDRKHGFVAKVYEKTL
ncbi:hypothetical protein J5N97_023879 [Dioscorea zingiberensis]|uniref:Uncharacterized protein n=1 Tax=Dioscorea zingiberensis TaxID=325984 RepID=A0A9D5H8E5_9LILI|nr:hypothetical protein J5N97_023879 [Dioscorea zingiberensis]